MRQLARRFQADIADMEHIDGVVPVAHTEGGAERPNNLEFLLRTLSGFVVHPNVGAVLIVDEGDEVVTNAMLETYMLRHNYPLDDVTHRFLTLQHDFHQIWTSGKRSYGNGCPKSGNVSVRKNRSPI